MATGSPGKTVARFLGSSADNVFAVGTGLAFDAPLVFVFDLTGPEDERTELDGVDRLEILGLGGDDRLSVGPGVFGDSEVPVLGGTVRLDGVDVILFRGGAGDDVLDGREADGPLIAFGGSGDDRLVGGYGDDKVVGGSGADCLRGGAGEDVLVGGLGVDRLKGGLGRDVFVYQNIADAPLRETARERIGDFKRGEDVIDLGAIEVASGGGFRFLGTFSPEVQLLFSGDLYFDPREQALKGFVGDFVSYAPNFVIALPGVKALDEDDLILTGRAGAPHAADGSGGSDLFGLA